MRLLKSIAVVLILLSCCSAYAEDSVRKITVSGRSENTVDAQYAEIQIMVKCVDKVMQNSHKKLMQTLSTLSGNLKSLGLDEKNIRKSLVLQGMEEEWIKQSRVHKGYYSTCAIDLHVENIGLLGNVYKEIANYKTISITGTEFRRNDEFELRNEELKKALLAAKKKAELMAETLNSKTGGVFTIMEKNIYNSEFTLQSEPEYANERASKSADSNFGKVKIIAEVEVSYELKQ